MIQVKRVYSPAEKSDGCRLLVERIWPRGLNKAELRLDGWMKEAAPSTELRKWFGHDPAKWSEFRRRYYAELEERPETWQGILEAATKGPVTLLFSSRDEEHNNVVALKDFLESRKK